MEDGKGGGRGIPFGSTGKGKGVKVIWEGKGIQWLKKKWEEWEERKRESKEGKGGEGMEREEG